MKVKASLDNLRISPRKVRLAAGLIKGLDVDQAMFQLENTVKGANPHVLKLLKSAIANGENNYGLDKNNLYIYDIQIGEGFKLKRWLPRAYGRATKILKRNSNVYLTLEEREEGKNRKSREQIEKERQEREKTQKKADETRRKEQEAEKEKTIESKAGEGKKELPRGPVKRDGEIGKEGKGGGKGWMKKVFQRKSG